MAPSNHVARADQKFAILISGLPRSLLSSVVRDSFQRHVQRVLPNSDLFFALVVESKNSSAHLLNEVATAYSPKHVSIVPKYRSVPGLRCQLPSSLSRRVLMQWVGLGILYSAVEAIERNSSIGYDWLLRTRTDMVYFADLPLASLSSRFAWVPSGGMNSNSQAQCSNDHIFICPRGLCRAYFMLLELWQSRHCVAAYGAAGDKMGRSAAALKDASPSVFASVGDGGVLRMGEQPVARFSIPLLPKGEFPEYYLRARYSDGSTCDGSNGVQADRCCGILREFDIPYAIARGNATHGFLACDANLISEWRTVALERAGGNRAALQTCRALSRDYTGVQGEGCEVPSVRDSTNLHIQCRRSLRHLPLPPVHWTAHES